MSGEQEANNERPEICARCGGVCCQRAAGAYWPDDFVAVDTPAFPRSLADVLSHDGGLVVVDWWEGDIDGGDLDQIYYLRPRQVDDPAGQVCCPSWDGACVHLTPHGCLLAFHDRPYSCRALVPGTSECVGVGGKEAYARAWRPYQKAVKNALEMIAYQEALKNALKMSGGDA